MSFKSNLHRRKSRQRYKIRLVSSQDRPRLSVHRTSSHIYAQIIDDSKGKTLVYASTLSPVLRDVLAGKTSNKEAAMKVGELIGKEALNKGITKVVFDRSGFLYHGRIKSLADGARQSGLNF